MSLDVSLFIKKEVVKADFDTNEDGDSFVFTANITHNLNTMAGAAGIYQHLWRPEEIGVKEAKELIHPLNDGLTRLKENPEQFKVFNPSNGWGTYEALVSFVENYLAACRQYPEATIWISR